MADRAQAAASFAGQFSLRPLRRDDFGAVSAWLAAPHVARWWRDPADAESVEREFGPVVDGRDPTEVFVLHAGEIAVGLLLRYRQLDYPEWARAVGVEDAIGIDYLIGLHEFTGRGLGSAAIRSFAIATLRLYPDIRHICAVPQQGNVASWRALEKAGFDRVQALEHIDSDHPADEGPAFIYVFARQTSDAARETSDAARGTSDALRQTSDAARETPGVFARETFGA